MKLSTHRLFITIPFEEFSEFKEEHNKLVNKTEKQDALLYNLQIFLSYICRTRDMEKEIDQFNKENEGFKIFKDENKRIKIVSDEWLEKRNKNDSTT